MNTIKCIYLVLSVFYAVQQSHDFVLLVALRPAGTHLPGPSDAVNTLTEVTCTQQRNKYRNNPPTFKSAIRLTYSYIHASSSHLTFNCLPIRIPNPQREILPNKLNAIFSSPSNRVNYSTYENDWYEIKPFFIVQCASLYGNCNKYSRTEKDWIFCVVITECHCDRVA